MNLCIYLIYPSIYLCICVCVLPLLSALDSLSGKGKNLEQRKEAAQAVIAVIEKHPNVHPWVCAQLKTMLETGGKAAANGRQGACVCFQVRAPSLLISFHLVFFSSCSASTQILIYELRHEFFFPVKYCTHIRGNTGVV